MSTDTKSDQADNKSITDNGLDQVQKPKIPTSSITEQLSDIPAKIADKIKGAESILVALSQDPSVDEISAALGLTILLDKIGKHVTAIYSGNTPNTLEFLRPNDTFEKDTNSLQDFIIAINKDKADHLRYKIEGDYVKVYITPYRTIINESDLEFDRGDYNVDLVFTIDVDSGDSIDGALSEYGRIMHDATAVNITVNAPGHFAETEWSDMSKSSVCEMIVNLADKLDFKDFDPNLSTALLTGIVASTNRFSNERTTPETMTIASRLMASGADQQLISANIMNAPVEAPAPEPEVLQVAEETKPVDPTTAALEAAAAAEEAADRAAAAAASATVQAPAPELAATPESVAAPELAATPEPIAAPEPTTAPETVPAPQPVTVTTPAPVPVIPESIAIAEPATPSAPATPAPATPEPVVAVEPTIEPAPAPQPAALIVEPVSPEATPAPVAPTPTFQPIVTQPGQNPAIAAAPILAATADETVPTVQFTPTAVTEVPAPVVPEAAAIPEVPIATEIPVVEPTPVTPEVPTPVTEPVATSIAEPVASLATELVTPATPVFEPAKEEPVGPQISRNDITPPAPAEPAVPPLPDFNSLPPAPQIDFSAPSMPPEIPAEPAYVPPAIPGATLDSLSSPASISTDTPAPTAAEAPVQMTPAFETPNTPAVNIPTVEEASAIPATDPAVAVTTPEPATPEPAPVAVPTATPAEEAPKAVSYTSFPPDPAAFQIPGQFPPAA